MINCKKIYLLEIDSWKTSGALEAMNENHLPLSACLVRSHHFAICHIHLASVGFDEKLFHIVERLKVRG